MMFTHALCALLAPSVAYAAAFPWSLPEPTTFIPAADNWSPAPTAAPQLPGYELFKRQSGDGGYTCAFISGSSESSITCSNTNFVCATNTRYGAQGCCDPSSMSFCTIPTTCIGATALSTLCTDAFCSTNAAIMKCTESAAPECYRYIISYSTTVMTQFGCAAHGFTNTAYRTWGPLPSSVTPALYRTVTVTETPSSTPTLTPSSESSKPSLGPIIGGTVGGCVILSVVALAAFLMYRRRKNQREKIAQAPVSEYRPHGYDANYVENEIKTWQQQYHGPVYRANDAMPQYPGMEHAGIVEVDGMQRPVEAPPEGIQYHR